MSFFNDLFKSSGSFFKGIGSKIFGVPQHHFSSHKPFNSAHNSILTSPQAVIKQAPRNSTNFWDVLKSIPESISNIIATGGRTISSVFSSGTGVLTKGISAVEDVITTGETQVGKTIRTTEETVGNILTSPIFLALAAGAVLLFLTVL